MARKKTTSPLIRLLYTFVFIIFILAGYLLYYTSQTMKVHESITIPKGSTSTVVESLDKQGYDVCFIDQIIIKVVGGLKYGKFQLPEKSYSRVAFYNALQDAKSLEIEVTLIPGETNEIFLRQISNKHKLSFEKLKKAYYDNTTIPDGVIFPDTYTFRYDINETKIIEYLINSSMKKHKDLSIELLGEFNQQKWFDKYVVIGSIIQKEAVDNGEMPLVSSVIYNRLNKNMPLQMDGSLNYGIYSHKKVTPERIRTDNSTYNTYKNRGLPDYPVCATSKEAIKAAVKPANSDYLYFMRASDGRHTFTKSFGEHRNVIDSVKKSNTN